MLRNWKRIVMMLLGAALLAGSLPLDAYADRDGRRHRDRKRECREARHDRDRDRDRGRHRDRDDDDDDDDRRSRRRDRDDYRTQHVVVYHRDECGPRRVVYEPRWPVHSGVSWSIYATNLPPNDYDYWDPYCERGYGSLNAYRSHVRHVHHPQVIHVVDDYGDPVCGYRNGGGDSWVRVAIAGGIRF